MQDVVAIRALIAEPSADAIEREIALLHAVIAKHPEKTEWRVNPVWPEELSSALESLGLPRHSIAQWQMQHLL